MSGIKVNISNILETLNDKLDFWQPIYESIVNSLEAHANEIDIYLSSKKDLTDASVLSSIRIVDNGEGFTRKNFDSFNEFLSALKRNKGCKGIGHFTWLKVFKDVKITSYTKESTYLDFIFNIEYDPTIVKIQPQEVKQSQTTIEFGAILPAYAESIPSINLDRIKEQFENHLLVKLSLLKNNNYQFNINIHHDNEIVSINNDNIIQLKNQRFSLTAAEREYDFNLYYSFFEATPKRRDLFYCANERTVTKFTNNIKIDKLPDNSSIIMLLTSPYFDERVSNLRNKFTFDLSDNNPSLLNPIPFPKINEQLQTTVDQIILKRYPSVAETNDATIEDCIAEFPYLAKYIRHDRTLIKNKKVLIEKAQKEYREEKENVKQEFCSMLRKQNIDTAEFSNIIQKVNDISSRELTQYFLYREQIIKALNKLNKEQSKYEEEIHTLLAPKGLVSASKEKHYYDTNVWLLDDKFLTYSELFSDKQIQEIKKHLGTENEKTYGQYKEPDITIFYNHVGNEYKDLVVIELKALGAKADQKISALPEINRNLQYVLNGVDDIRNVYGYVITTIDKEFQLYLESQPGVKSLFSKGNTPFYYYYNENIKDKNGNKKGAHVYIVSLDSIYQDAKMRNDTFINIIKNK